MHLGSLTISQFRFCNNLTVSLCPDLTVLVGENNGGKSNVVDAIRLLTLPLSGRRERYPEDEDVRQLSQGVRKNGSLRDGRPNSRSWCTA